MQVLVLYASAAVSIQRLALLLLPSYNWIVKTQIGAMSSTRGNLRWQLFVLCIDSAGFYTPKSKNNYIFWVNWRHSSCRHNVQVGSLVLCRSICKIVLETGACNFSIYDCVKQPNKINDIKTALKAINSCSVALQNIYVCTFQCTCG